MDTTVSTICLSSAYYPPHTGGVEVFTQNIARELINRGVAVTVVTNGVDDSPAHEVMEDGVEVFRLPATDPVGRYPIPKYSAEYKSLWKEIDRRDFDAVVVNTRFYPLSLKMLSLASRKGLRPVLIEHGSSYLTLGNPGLDLAIRAYENSIGIPIRRTRPLCYGVSRQASSWLSNFGLKAAGTIHNSIDAEAFAASSSGRDFRSELSLGTKPLIAFTGRMIAEKGIWTVVETARELEDTDCRFLIAGDGPELEKLREQAPSNMSVLGRLSHPDIAALLTQTDILLFPSRYPEGLPTSLLEAASCGVYIITSDVAGADEVIPDRSYGMVLTQARADQCASAIRMALGNPEFMKSCAERCREYVATEFSWQKAADDLLHACDIAAHTPEGGIS